MRFTRITAISATGTFNLVWFRASVCGEEINVNATERIQTTTVQVISNKEKPSCSKGAT
jgi:hypothetical protein